MKWTNCFYLFLVTNLIACSTEDEDFQPVYDVPIQFEPYVNAFFTLAQERGVDLEQHNLIIRFEDNLEVNNQPVCGTSEGPLNDEEQHLILIDEQCLAWRNSDESREILIFHELGHVYLERLHDDTVFPSGDYKSIMFGGNWNILKFYTQDQFKRDYYINELFNPLEPSPAWAD